ncbi:MAG: glycosyltransferase family 2 protein [Desulfurivibrionaceae bacterium]
MNKTDPQNQTEVTILLPAYNEELAIGSTVRNLRDRYPGYEVLVVDDGSSDDTARMAEEAGARVKSHPYNIGNGAAIKTGLRAATGDWIIMMDADGQHEPEDVARLLVYQEGYDMVIGARTRKSDTSMHRDIANKLYNAMASFVCKFKVEDLTSGFRLIRRETAMEFIHLLPNTFSYPSTLTLACLRSGLGIKYIPIETRRRKGKSKIKLFQDGARFFIIITKIATLFSPLRVFLPISFLFFITGFGYYAYTFITANRFSNMSALLLSTAIIIFMMGLVSEQITQLRYDRHQNRP